VTYSESIATVCRVCSTQYPIQVPQNAPIASAQCPSCTMLNYASRYERIDIGLSEVCNLSGNMCRRPQEREFMSPQRVRRLLSEARTIGVKTISFSGGEPFVHPHFRILLETALGHGFAVELVTNGTLVRASDIPNLERLNCITVSVDGPKEVHDLIRGKRRDMERTMATLRLLKNSRAKWGTNTRNTGPKCRVIALKPGGSSVRPGRRPILVSRTSRSCRKPPSFSRHQQKAAEAKRQVELVREECLAAHVHFNDDAIVTRMYDVFANKSGRYRPRQGCDISKNFLGVSQYDVFPCCDQGRSIKADGLIQALETDLCRDIDREATDRRCIGCNAANYSWNKAWVEGIHEAAAAGEWSNGVVYLSDRERKLSAISPGRCTLPLLERGIPREA
jgi:Radical SAM superfamily